MGILTLVENSIKHGISNLQQGGTLLLNSRIENDLLLIQVSNPYRKDLVNSGTQVGLKNLTQRIALIFGEQGKLSQHNTEDTFIVNLSLPYQVV
jgi:LytS/YehU family sensor histidine kinase